jgi:hypothetical protein
LYDGLPLAYGEVRSAPVAVPTSPSGYLRFRDADGGVSGATAGNRISSFTTATGRAEGGAGAGMVDEEETDGRRAEDEEGGAGFAAADTDGGGKAADEGGGTGRVHLTSQGGGGGMWAAGTLIR